MQLATIKKAARKKCRFRAFRGEKHGQLQTNSKKNVKK
jgi:hypothetical protein